MKGSSLSAKGCVLLILGALLGSSCAEKQPVENLTDACLGQHPYDNANATGNECQPQHLKAKCLYDLALCCPETSIYRGAIEVTACKAAC